MQTVPAKGGVIQLPLFRAGRLKPAHTLDVHAVSLPATAFTGDFYFTYRYEDRLWFALGDVAGHGLSAAVVMAMIQEELEHRIISCSRTGPAGCQLDPRPAGAGGVVDDPPPHPRPAHGGGLGLAKLDSGAAGQYRS